MRRKNISSTTIPIVGSSGTATRRVDDRRVLTKLWGEINATTIKEACQDASPMLTVESACWIIDARDVTSVDKSVSDIASKPLNLFKRLESSDKMIAIVSHPGLRMLLSASNLAIGASLHICESVEDAEVHSDKLSMLLS